MEALHLTEESKNRIISNLKNRYLKLSLELDKVRDCSALKDGWGTSKLAKKQRKADELSKEKHIIRNILFDDWGIEV